MLHTFIVGLVRPLLVESSVIVIFCYFFDVLCRNYLLFWQNIFSN